MKVDVIVIGAGIIGSFVARELARYDIEVAVLEKNSDVANEATMANSAIVHSGYDPKPGTNKAKYNVLGNQMYEQVCHELDCEFKQIGSLTVATDENEINVLKGLMERSKLNQVPFEYLDQQQVREIEPNISDHVLGAMLAPTAAIVYPWELAIGLMENAMDNGVKLYLRHEVTDISRTETGYEVTTTKGVFTSELVINAAGVFSDKIHNMMGEAAFSITPRRGQYYVLDSTVGNLVNHVIFPCPSEKGKGVLITPTTHGNMLIGPTSEVIEDKFGIQTTREGLAYVRDHADKLVKDIPYHKVIRSFAGLRPSSNRKDFIIEEAKGAKGFIDVAGIESPGLASAPAIAKEVLRLVGTRLNLQQSKSFNPYRKGYVKFSELSIEDKQKIIQKDYRYGQIVCRCETVTEGEIVDCIRRNAGATTIKGVKKRVRPGMGRCQGGFCEPLVLDILARELGIDVLEVEYDSEGSTILIEETKVGDVQDERI